MGKDTRKQNVLKNLLALIANESNLKSDNSVSMFGTKAFNEVWEACCKVAFDDKIPKPKSKEPTLASLGLQPLIGDANKTTLLDVIAKPLWRVTKDDSDETDINHKEGLIPDIISIFERPEDHKKAFLILDAKYYRFDYEGKKFIYGVPGVGDIDKQFLYHLAYRDFIKHNGIEYVYNAFIMPTDATAPIIKGKVSVGYFKYAFGVDVPPDIEIRLVPADEIFKYYLDNNPYDIASLQLNDTFYANRRDDEQNLM